MSTANTVALLEALLMFAPELPELTAAVQTAVRLIHSGAAPTAEEQAQIDAGLDAANKALQAS